jgi:hypothetical protein
MILNNAPTVIKFNGSSYPTSIDGQTKSFPDIILKSALISVSQAKQIIKTQIQGRDGSVKEYIGLDDYAISIVGTITSTNNVEPIQDRLDLKAMLDAPISIGVVCPYLNQLGITDVVIESYDLPQQAGGISYQTFSINCISEYANQLRIASV